MINQFGTQRYTRRMERHFWGLNAAEWAAVTSIVNVLLVAILVLVNIRYMRSAAEQAEAARGQARAASEQASLASETINRTAAQLKEQFMLKLTEIISDFRQLNYRLDFLINKVRTKWGQGVEHLDSMLPPTWPSMVYMVRTQMTSHGDHIDRIERGLTNAVILLNDQMLRQPNAREHEMFLAAANDLEEASKSVKAILTLLQNSLNAALPNSNRA